MMAKRDKIDFSIQPTLPFEEWDAPAEPQRGPLKDDSELAIGDEDILADGHQDRLLNFISFGSGSSGNSCYIGNSRGGIIVDAGVQAEEIERILAINGVNMKMAKALLLTHDHSDHVKYAYTLLRRNQHIRLYCTNRVLNGLLRRHNISRRIKDYHNPIFKEIPFKILNFEITAFEVLHDGTDNMGFAINFDRHKFVLATDLGTVSDRARHYMSAANYLVIESNYDLDMLRNGRYPEYLKARIQTEHGHLDNTMTAAFLKEIFNPSLKYVFLCHLSKDNNTPAKALKASREALAEAGAKVGDCGPSILDRSFDVHLMALPRFEPSPWFVFRPTEI